MPPGVPILWNRQRSGRMYWLPEKRSPRRPRPFETFGGFDSEQGSGARGAVRVGKVGEGVTVPLGVKYVPHRYAPILSSELPCRDRLGDPPRPSHPPRWDSSLISAEEVVPEGRSRIAKVVRRLLQRCAHVVACRIALGARHHVAEPAGKRRSSAATNNRNATSRLFDTGHPAAGAAANVAAGAAGSITAARSRVSAAASSSRPTWVRKRW